jgi:hypothetical protein
MTRDLGVWTAPDCALVLIDYQEEMLSSILSEPDGIEPLKDGSDVRYVTDAAGRRSQRRLMEGTRWPAGGESPRHHGYRREHGTRCRPFVRP